MSSVIALSPVHPNPVIAEDIERVISSGIDWSPLSDCRVLVTGAGGFLPAYMVEVLLALGRHPEMTNERPPEVIALVRSESRAWRRFSHHRDNLMLRFLVQDVSENLPQDVKPAYVIHAASPASPKYYRDDPVGTIRPNTAGTESLLRRAAETNARGFLYFSTSEVYGALPEASIPTREDQFGVLDPTDPRACYAEAKRLGETMCLGWHRQFGVPAKIVRPFHVYGPGMSLDDGRVFADFVADILAGRDITLLSAGTAARSFCYLSEATEAFFRILLQGEAGHAYNLGNPDGECSISTLADTLAALYPEKNLKVRRVERSTDSAYMPSTIERSCPDITRLMSLDWWPRIGIEQGFGRTIDSFAEETVS